MTMMMTMANANLASLMMMMTTVMATTTTTTDDGDDDVKVTREMCAVFCTNCK
jgi:hypothetical protein